MTPGDSFYLYSIGTVSSAGLERCLDRAEVAGSNPAEPTIVFTRASSDICVFFRPVYFLQKRRLVPLLSINIIR